MRIKNKNYRTVWFEDNSVNIIDQKLLPHKFEILKLNDVNKVANAIKRMNVRGAPAIAATAGFGLALSSLKFKGKDFDKFLDHMIKSKKILENTRPTAYELFYTLNFVFNVIKNHDDVKEAQNAALRAASMYANSSVDKCKKIGEFGEKLIKNNANILTHCNAGALACVDIGTALAPMRLAHNNNKKIHVFVDETRPRCQGSRLTAWELLQEGIKHSVIADNAAGYYMAKREVDLVIVGADRITLSGDVVNKIGTYEKAVLAKENKIPFYVAAPLATIDKTLGEEDYLVIEERGEDEVLGMFGWNKKFTKVRIAPSKSKAKNPAFDITPAKYITGIITEKGIFKADEIGKIS